MYRLAKGDDLHRAAWLAAAGAAAAAAGGVMLAQDPVHALRWAGPPLVALAVTRGDLRERLRSLALALVGLLVYLLWGAYPLFADAVAGLALGLVLVRQADAARARRAVAAAEWKLGAWSLGLAVLSWVVGVRALAAARASVLGQGLVPPVVLAACAAGLVGLLVGLSAAPAHLETEGDPVAAALHRARPTLDGELRDLLLRIVDARSRALKLLERSRADGVARAETRRGLDGLALAAIDLTDRFGAVDRVLSRTPLSNVDERLLKLRASLEAATDAGVRRDLERACASLGEQREQVERLVQGRARLVARLESELASLEKAEMALALFATGDAALAGLRLEAIGQGLARQATELEAEGFALQEALAAAPPGARPA